MKICTFATNVASIICIEVVCKGTQNSNVEWCPGLSAFFVNAISSFIILCSVSYKLFFSVEIFGRFVCPNQCGRHYKQKHHMTYHLKVECGKEPTYECPICHRKYTRKYSIKTHVTLVHGILYEDAIKMVYNRNDKLTFLIPGKYFDRFYCPNNCGHNYKRKGHMMFHFRFECGKPPLFRCTMCSRKFHQKSSLKTHVVSVHKMLFNNSEIGDRFMCPNGCGRHYKHKTHMSYHWKFECGKSPKFICPKCDRRFYQKSNLKTHVVTKHKILYSQLIL
ncbi:GDNF-inducible zinc finger protein 1-like [Daktulosphaira vitifoliae]|uniref:GDNF-inducible zinc finger protein 1-like n=1 Tax=Daktulosphaira vitifoliae TaxID=58002 RepID=UPI0021A9A698|nr:GDNF-inducible zinc finger protein 1-like [Daktulosphaira vitifoliae]